MIEEWTALDNWYDPKTTLHSEQIFCRFWRKCYLKQFDPQMMVDVIVEVISLTIQKFRMLPTTCEDLLNTSSDAWTLKSLKKWNHKKIIQTQKIRKSRFIVLYSCNSFIYYFFSFEDSFWKVSLSFTCFFLWFKRYWNNNITLRSPKDNFTS